jgi:hypothetical protein
MSARPPNKQSGDNRIGVYILGAAAIVLLAIAVVEFFALFRT